MISILAALVLAQAWPGDVTPRPRLFRSDGAVRMNRLGADTIGPLCDIITTDDKSGAWECMYGDGTMATGSATTFTATGTPTNTTENGYAVRTYTNAQNDQQPANAAFPASDFSVCMHHRSTTLAASQLMAFGTTGAPANFAVLPWEMQGAGGGTIAYVSNGTASTGSFANGTFTAGAWTFACFTYTRTGGAADNIGISYMNGAQSATSTNMRLAQALSSKWATNGYVGGSSGNAKSVRGIFITYKKLTASDIARLYASLPP